MPRISPIDPSKASGDTAVQLDVARKAFGGTPNLVTTAANSAPALAAMLGLFANMRASSLGPKLGEQIAIAVAQSNGCGYCLSAHTAIGKLHGLDASELSAAKRASSADPRAEAILSLAVDINRARGKVTDAALAKARLAGVTDAEIVEIVGHVALNVFTNYLNNVSETQIDFPVVALDVAA